MRRREFITGLRSAAAWPLAARAQQRPMPVIGWLNNPTPGTMEGFLPAFKQGLADTGYVVGSNVTIESREGGIDQLPALATDLDMGSAAIWANMGQEPRTHAEQAQHGLGASYMRNNSSS